MHPVAPEDRERSATRGEDLCRDDSLVELARRSRRARRGLSELRILKDAAEHEVVACELGEGRDESPRGFLVDEVGEQDRKRTPRGLRTQELERRAVVGLGRGHLETAEALGQAKELPV